MSKLFSSAWPNASIKVRFSSEGSAESAKCATHNLTNQCTEKTNAFWIQRQGQIKKNSNQNYTRRRTFAPISSFDEKNRAHPNLVIPGFTISISAWPHIQSRMNANRTMSGSSTRRVVIRCFHYKLLPSHIFCFVAKCTQLYYGEIEIIWKIVKGRSDWRKQKENAKKIHLSPSTPMCLCISILFHVETFLRRRWSRAPIHRKRTFGVLLMLNYVMIVVTVLDRRSLVWSTSLFRCPKATSLPIGIHSYHRKWPDLIFQSFYKCMQLKCSIF